MSDQNDDETDGDDEVFTDQPNIWQIIDPINLGGRPVAYEPEELWLKACEYFDWCQKSQLLELKVFGSGLKKKVPHERPFTRQGLSVFLGITPKTLDNYETWAEYKFVISAIRSIMFEQKFSGAAAGLMNANLIARELGLAERVKQITDAADMTDEQIEERYEELMQKAAAKSEAEKRIH